MQTFLPNRGFLPGRRICGIKKRFTIYADDAFIRFFQKIETAQKSRLTASGRTDDGYDFPFFERETDILQNFCMIKRFTNVFYF